MPTVSPVERSRTFERTEAFLLAAPIGLATGFGVAAATLGWSLLSEGKADWLAVVLTAFSVAGFLGPGWLAYRMRQDFVRDVGPVSVLNVLELVGFVGVLAAGLAGPLLSLSGLTRPSASLAEVRMLSVWVSVACGLVFVPFALVRTARRR